MQRSRLPLSALKGSSGGGAKQKVLGIETTDPARPRYLGLTNFRVLMAVATVDTNTGVPWRNTGIDDAMGCCRNGTRSASRILAIPAERSLTSCCPFSGWDRP